MKNPIVDSIATAGHRVGTVARAGAAAASTKYRSVGSSLTGAAVRMDAADPYFRWKVGLPTAAAVGASIGFVAATWDEPETEPVTTGLGPEVDELVAESPTLTAKVRKLLADGWTIGYADIDARGLTNRARKVIELDVQNRDDPLLTTAVLAHEVGHASAPEYAPVTSLPEPGETYAEWFRRHLTQRYENESNAQLAKADARREILDRGGPDIGDLNDLEMAAYDGYAAGDLSKKAAIDLLVDNLWEHPGPWFDYYKNSLDGFWEENVGPVPEGAGQGGGNVGTSFPDRVVGNGSGGGPASVSGTVGGVGGVTG